MATNAGDLHDINAPAKAVPENESSDTQFIDPLFLEKEEVGLADDPDNETEIPDDPEPAREDDAGETLEKLIADNPDADDDDPGEGSQNDKGAAGEAEKAKAVKDASQDRRNDRRVTMRERAEEAEARNEALEKRLEALEKGDASADEAGAEDDPDGESEDNNEGEAGDADELGPAPTLEDHDYDMDAFTLASQEWNEKRTEQVVEKALATRDQRTKDNEAETAETARRADNLAAFDKRVKAFTGNHEDYGDVVAVGDIPPMAIDLIVESEVGPELAYHISQHAKDFQHLHDANPVQVGVEMGKLEARLLAEKASNGTGSNAEKAAADRELAAEAERRAVETSTITPEPANTLSGGGSGENAPDLENMGQDEYNAGRLSGKIK